MKIAHESMNDIFPVVQRMTDYDYILVHLLDENEQYSRHMHNAINAGRETILDNSIFELGEAYNEARYNYWISALRPTYTIIPDVLNSYKGTIDRLNEWFKKYPDTNDYTKAMAVVQGQNEDEALACFDQLQHDNRIAKIGISFDSSSHLPKDVELSADERMHRHMEGRLNFLLKASRGKINKPVHLLGCSLPQEMKYYVKLGFIDSVDTSSPVVHGFFGIKYAQSGLARKHPQKLFTLIDELVTVDQMNDIAYNIVKFREFTK